LRQALDVVDDGVLLAEDVGIELVGLVAPMFSLDLWFSVSDVLFVAELEGRLGYLLDMGLESKELDEQMEASLENEQ